MNGADATTPRTGDQRRGRGRGGTRALLAGVIAVALAAAAAVAAISTAARRGEPTGEAPTTAAAVAEPPGPTTRRVTERFPADYTGPVWVTVTVAGTAGDAGPRDLELSWGPWRRWIRQQGAGPTAYWFEKKDRDAVPVSIEVPEGADAVFGHGTLPDGAVDARAGWSRRPAGAPGGDPPPATSAGS